MSYMGNLTTALLDYEEGRLDREETIELFQQLVDTGLAWTLQGHYGRIAHDLVEWGLVHVGGRWGTA